MAYASASGASRTVTYSYDAVGNRTSVVDGAATTTYTTNNLNQYTSVGGTNYTYSTRGELTGDGTWTYSYDQENHLVGASKSGTSVTYSYDVLGRRTSKAVNGTTTNYVYSGQNLIEERDGSGAVLKKYVYAGGLDHPVQAVIGTSVYYFTQDVLGNVVALTDSAGSVVESYTYDVYGSPMIKDGLGNVLAAAMTPFLFTGREYDGETGLYHYRARAYHPALGRFMQNDKINFNGGGVNLYAYVKNSPLNKTDHLGLCPDDDTDRRNKELEDEFNSPLAPQTPRSPFDGPDPSSGLDIGNGNSIHAGPAPSNLDPQIPNNGIDDGNPGPSGGSISITHSF